VHIRFANSGAPIIAGADKAELKTGLRAAHKRRVIACAGAVFSYLFAARYDRAPDDVAGIVLLSTLFSMVTLPFVVARVVAAQG
jgi:predicted permease